MMGENKRKTEHAPATLLEDFTVSQNMRKPESERGVETKRLQSGEGAGGARRPSSPLQGPQSSKGDLWEGPRPARGSEKAARAF